MTRHTKVIVALAVIATGVLIAFAYARWQDISRYAEGPLSPPATMLDGASGEIINGKPLKKIAEISRGSSELLEVGQATNHDDLGNLVMSIYYRDDFFTEILAVTVRNNSTSEVIIEQLQISGYTPCYFVEGCQRQTLSRPVISLPTETVPPTTTQHKLLSPGESFTAFIQGHLAQPGYSAATCYSYDVQDLAAHYCSNTSPVAWVRWF